MIKFISERCKRFSLTESVVLTALQVSYDTKHIIDLLLEYGPAFHVQDTLIAVSVAQPDCNEVLFVYREYGIHLVLTEDVMRAGIRKSLDGDSYSEDAKLCNLLHKFERQLSNSL